MTASNNGPIFAGEFSENNKTSFSFSPSVAIPSGAFLWLGLGSQVIDTANVTITDSQNNPWTIQAFNQLPGANATILVAYVLLGPNGLSTTDTITITSDTRANWDGLIEYFTGVEGAVNAADLEFSTNTTPQTNIRGAPGNTLLSILAVLGPSSDAFTPDPNWGPDQKMRIASTQATIHSCGATAPTLGIYPYAPILGTARTAYTFSASFT